jgi:hypothetical protein
MELEYTYWEDGDGWLLGYLNDYPEQLTQGKGVEDLEMMLLDLYKNLKVLEEDKKTMSVQEKKNGRIKIPA